MIAKYDGICAKCRGRVIAHVTEILPVQGRFWVHENCRDDALSDYDKKDARERQEAKLQELYGQRSVTRDEHFGVTKRDVDRAISALVFPDE